jgi:phosphoglycerol transferase MdoB-like AlkP superfamily enzyme
VTRIIPKYWQIFALKMSILMLIFTFCRILFHLHNSEYFPSVGLSDYLAGAWFDLISCCLLFFPLAILELFPNKDRNRRWIRLSINFFTWSPVVLGTLINLIDVEYYHHTSSRSNAGLIKMLGYGNDLGQQLPAFFVDYWFILVYLFLMLFIFWLALKKLTLHKSENETVGLKKQAITYVITLFLIVFIARGGFVSKPIRATEAAKYTSAENVQFILNSAFKVINSWDSKPITEKDYFSQSELTEIFSPNRQYSSENRLKDQNIVIIILESFAIEYIDRFNLDHENYTPFFDQLADSSLMFTNCFANGKKSLDAVPSIIASIPKLMETEYSISPYNSNSLEALPNILSKNGYSTGFYHGATNGSMNFDSFTAFAGFEHYYGRSEYDNNSDYDGTWGIYDEEFMSWSVDEFSKMKKPFFSALFTISSHPPFAIPEKYKTVFNDGPSERHNAISYTDFALKKFFEKAKQQEWYDSTLFILVADHTPGSSRRIYLHERGQLNIPMLFFHPSDSFFRGSNDAIVSQVDIMPTVLDLIGYQKPFYSFGTSVFNKHEQFSVSELGGKFILFGEINQVKYTLVFQNDEALALYRMDDLYQDREILADFPEVTATLTKKMKALIQTYNYDLINNQTTAN